MLKWLAVLSVVAPIFYALFIHDVMNRIQYFERLGVYWVTRDVVPAGTPLVTRAFMRQVAEPYWRGEGIQLRFRKHTFQIGRLQYKVDSLESQIGRLGWLSADVVAMREWD